MRTLNKVGLEKNPRLQTPAYHSRTESLKTEVEKQRGIVTNMAGKTSFYTSFLPLAVRQWTSSKQDVHGHHMLGGTGMLCSWVSQEEISHSSSRTSQIPDDDAQGWAGSVMLLGCSQCPIYTEPHVMT